MVCSMDQDEEIQNIHISFNCFHKNMSLRHLDTPISYIAILFLLFVGLLSALTVWLSFLEMLNFVLLLLFADMFPCIYLQIGPLTSCTVQ